MTVSVTVKKRVIERDGGFCLMMLPGCSGEAQTTHHRANRGSGGSTILDHPANLCAVCVPCNGAAEDAGAIVRADLIERGLRVEKAATNAATLHRSKATLVQAIDGEWYYLVSATMRRHVSEGRPEDGA
ncbi:hypothetical protein J2Y69_003574 [Microbacterium resistens]|uniref:HNH endonuclease n=1 Tax=Microbacterium resistens TaxID=156977 RepID=A0ABU1SH70_9MICO|nr:hypothetical protein [Microbacterium resistens]MDR6868948.1 hypothetical protein [Microbacterium resistens]